MSDGHVVGNTDENKFGMSVSGNDGKNVGEKIEGGIDGLALGTSRKVGAIVDKGS